jgi:uncharacterized protein YcgI (DUF1989 family)
MMARIDPAEPYPRPAGIPPALDMSAKHPRFQLDRAFYDRLRKEKPNFRLVERFVIPPYNGRGFRLRKGQTFRVIQETDPQIADVAFWNGENTKEYFSAMRTFLAEGWIVRPNTRLWSDLPWFRPMMTCLDDTVPSEPGADYHHHFVGNQCSAESNEMRFGVAGLNGCRLNLLQAIEQFGLIVEDIRENINIHEKNRADPITSMRKIGLSNGRRGDYIEFYAEMPLIVGVSACPYGNGLKTPMMADACSPLGIEIYDTGIEPLEFPRWTPWAPRA